MSGIGQVIRQQKGVALIIVLLIVALVSVLATEMGSRLQLQVKRASNIKDNNQAYWYAMGAEQYAQKSIKYLLDNSDGVIHLDQQWSEPFVYPLDGGGIEAQLSDMQSCFNVNSLRSGEQGSNTEDTSSGSSERQMAFKRLMENINGDISTYDIDTFSDSLVDWLDADSNMLQQGAEDSEYESRQFPYLAANNLMAHKSELRLVNGVSIEWLDLLLKQVCVIPGNDQLKINVNTVDEKSAPVLAALTGLALSDAQDVIANRPKEGFKTKADFLADNAITALNMPSEREDWFDVTTSHFILQVKTTYNNATFSMATVFAVDDSQNVSILRREFGTL
ncbi:type II secretion system minor pseudopilin GspK [Paraglaciecola polaris]|uniref:Type II secretion system protein K n=1 Tax=Paraglaciecola polaris LMG 21857 TaxID=1129793 RepID=K7A344_9ALTE|nr:type II secretion system minor pseudopilin GspK [Paraglaciecola polaris]GAC35303.1 general secretion pathway protein K [Paraglaciecola polaris LMG 21857]|tara:strand:- start:35834 stop:36838 length:1005 start_codon:yes stop_codon:yes gene_type:complete